jgi:hypothetical protein
MHARHVRAIPSGVFAEPLNAATDNVFPQEGQVFSVIMSWALVCRNILLC